MNVTTHSGIPVYTVAGSSNARELPEWLIRKRKRSLKKDPEWANRVELLQDFSFPEASNCVRVSEDGNWVMSTGTYKPQIHTHYLPDLALSFSRHTNCLNLKFIILSQDISKSLHLQTDRYIELHKQGGLHHKLRIPRYGRDLVYNRRDAEALIPAVGVNNDGAGEVYRLNLELGRFMKPYEIDVGGDDLLTPGAGSLQGGINTGAVNTAAVAEESHNLMAFGTSIGTVEFWDPRANANIGVLGIPKSIIHNTRPEVTAVKFQRNGISFAAGDSHGMTYLYDLRSPNPVQKKDQGNDFPIKDIIFLDSSISFKAQTPESKILTYDKKVIKIWDRNTTKNWAWAEPDVDLNHVEWCQDSGMLLTANEGRQQHAFFIPQLGPAPKWCSFLDNIVEEMAEDANDPNAYNATKAGTVYDNYKFLTMSQLQTLNIDHLIGTTSLLRPYMHGYFVSQKLYEEASLISNPTLWEEQRTKKIKQKVEAERESRIRGRKVPKARQNQQLVDLEWEREEKNRRRKEKRKLAKGVADDGEAVDPEEPSRKRTLFDDERFEKIFNDPDFIVDENSREFGEMNPIRRPDGNLPKGLTAVDEDMLDRNRNDGSSNDDNSGSDDSSDSEIEQERPKQTKSKDTWKKTSKPITNQPPVMIVVNHKAKQMEHSKNKSFSSRLANHRDQPKETNRKQNIVGEKQVSFTPAKKREYSAYEKHPNQPGRFAKKDRRSASNNAFRGL